MKLLEFEGYSITLELDGQAVKSYVWPANAQVVSLMRLDEGGYFLEAVGETCEEVEDWATSLNSLYAEKPKLSLPEALGDFMFAFLGHVFFSNLLSSSPAFFHNSLPLWASPFQPGHVLSLHLVRSLARARRRPSCCCLSTVSFVLGFFNLAGVSVHLAVAFSTLHISFFTWCLAASGASCHLHISPSRSNSVPRCKSVSMQHVCVPCTASHGIRAVVGLGATASC